jgi:hypothetical protein
MWSAQGFALMGGHSWCGPKAGLSNNGDRDEKQRVQQGGKIRRVRAGDGDGGRTEGGQRVEAGTMYVLCTPPPPRVLPVHRSAIEVVCSPIITRTKSFRLTAQHGRQADKRGA